jgi:hypothetical protein
MRYYKVGRGKLSEDEFVKKLKKKMAICTILQRKFGCKCAENETIPFCNTVEELYKECVITKS